MFDRLVGRWERLMNMFTRAKRHEVETEQGWIEEAETIPYIQFPPSWQIKIMPPFSDAVVRFKVTLPSGLEKSVFLDSRCSLIKHRDKDGRPIPCWEVAPVAGKWAHCAKYNIQTLLKLIAREDE